MIVPENIHNQRILFSPLNWGWGHVSRSIPLLKSLSSQKNKIYIACSMEQQKVYENYLEDVVYLNLEGYPFRFRGKGNFHWDLFFSLHHLIPFAQKEKNWVNQQTEQLQIDVVISDHRYFFYSDLVASVFVTHQLNLPLPGFLKWTQKLHQRWIRKFSTIWVVDDPRVLLAGKLSDLDTWKQENTLYVGILSRLKGKEQAKGKKWTTVLVSGPEVYAEQFFAQQNYRLENQDTCIIYKGVFYTKQESRPITWKEIDAILLETKLLVARSGYSTLMDAHYLMCNTEWHPTPGQWEQEYLALRS